MKTRFTRADYWLRLLGLTVFSLLVVDLIANLYLMERGLAADTTPVPSVVTLPDSFAHEVETVTLTGADGIRLAAWYVPSQNGAAVILLHGYSANRLQILFQADALAAAGYGVLLLDLRGHGESAGARRSYGWADVDDMAGALAFLHAQPEIDSEQMGIFGFSVGGQVALRATARYPELKAVFADGPSPAVFGDQPAPHSAYEWFALPAALLHDARLAAWADTPIPAGVLDTIGQIAPRPIFLVACGYHPYTPGVEIRISHRYAEAAGDNAQLWELPDVGHGNAPRVYPEAYRARLVGFFDAALALSADDA